MHELDDITGAVVDAAVKIHKELGPGLLESVYEVVLARELERRGFQVERQSPFALNTTGWFSRKVFALTSSSKAGWLSSSNRWKTSHRSTVNNCLPIFGS